jgi:hypothetical protein
MQVLFKFLDDYVYSLLKAVEMDFEDIPASKSRRFGVEPGGP